MESSFAGLWSPPLERYIPERKAEFLLSNAIDAADDRKGPERGSGASACSGFDSPSATQIMVFLRPPAGTWSFFRSGRYGTSSCAASGMRWRKRGSTSATKISGPRLTRLSRSLHLFEAGQTLLPSEICLPEKDLPILLAAIEARATRTECTSDI